MNQLLIIDRCIFLKPKEVFSTCLFAVVEWGTIITTLRIIKIASMQNLSCIHLNFNVYITLVNFFLNERILNLFECGCPRVLF